MLSLPLSVSSGAPPVPPRRLLAVSLRPPVAGGDTDNDNDNERDDERDDDKNGDNNDNIDGDIDGLFGLY